MGSHWGEKIRRYLQSLYPVAYQRWKVVLISSLVVFLILLVLQPFGISGIRQHKFWILVGFMGVTAVSLSIPMYVFGKLFPKFYKEETWTVWKQIVNLLQILFFYSYRELDLFYFRFWLGITLGCLLCLCIIHFGHRTFSYCTFHFVESK